MRYGAPSILDTLARLQRDGVTDVTVFPLYPQYARASTKTVVTKVARDAKRLGYSPAWRWVPAFYDAPAFIDAFVAVGRRAIDTTPHDKVLLSFHGYPERYLREDDPSGAHCLRRPDCCDVAVDANRDCYKHQCVATAKALTARLGLRYEDVAVCYQSRLRDNWARPFTDTVVVDAARAGAKRLLVFCPAFVADCLETLEEIAIRADEDFREHGGEKLTLVPSLNSEPEWVSAVVSLARAVDPAL
jgi:ferrochelatase